METEARGTQRGHAPILPERVPACNSSVGEVVRRTEFELAGLERAKRASDYESNNWASVVHGVDLTFCGTNEDLSWVEKTV